MRSLNSIVAGAMLGGVALGGVLVGALTNESASAQLPTRNRVVCSGTFSSDVYSSIPAALETQSVGVNQQLELSAVGRARLEINREGSVTGALELQDGNTANIFGQVNGRAINLMLELSGGSVVYGVGTARNNMIDCNSIMGGPAVMEGKPMFGSWVFRGEDRIED